MRHPGLLAIVLGFSTVSSYAAGTSFAEAAWSWNQAVHHIAMGKADLNPLFVYYSWNDSAYPADSMRMTFVTNHDQNAWEGTQWTTSAGVP